MAHSSDSGAPRRRWFPLVFLRHHLDELSPVDEWDLPWVFPDRRASDGTGPRGSHAVCLESVSRPPIIRRLCTHCNPSYGPGSIYTGCGVCGGLVHVNCVRPHYERLHPGQPIPQGYGQPDGGMEACDLLAFMDASPCRLFVFRGLSHFGVAG